MSTATAYKMRCPECGWQTGGNRKVDPRTKYSILPVQQVFTDEAITA